MSEKWSKSPDQETLSEDEVVYNVTNEIIVRSIQRAGLLREKNRLQSEINAIDADLIKIAELQVAELD